MIGMDRTMWQVLMFIMLLILRIPKRGENWACAMCTVRQQANIGPLLVQLHVMASSALAQKVGDPRLFPIFVHGSVTTLFFLPRAIQMRQMHPIWAVSNPAYLKAPLSSPPSWIIYRTCCSISYYNVRFGQKKMSASRVIMCYLIDQLKTLKSNNLSNLNIDFTLLFAWFTTQ